MEFKHWLLVAYFLDQAIVAALSSVVDQIVYCRCELLWTRCIPCLKIVNILKNSIKAKDATPCGFLTFFDSVCQKSSTTLPLLTVAEKHVRKSLLLPASQMLHRFCYRNPW
jgi:hypothetical protein